jgi:hypothetical protein
MIPRKEMTLADRINEAFGWDDPADELIEELDSYDRYVDWEELRAAPAAPVEVSVLDVALGRRAAPVAAVVGAAPVAAPAAVTTPKGAADVPPPADLPSWDEMVAQGDAATWQQVEDAADAEYPLRGRMPNQEWVQLVGRFRDWLLVGSKGAGRYPHTRVGYVALVGRALAYMGSAAATGLLHQYHARLDRRTAAHFRKAWALFVRMCREGAIRFEHVPAPKPRRELPGGMDFRVKAWVEDSKDAKFIGTYSKRVRTALRFMSDENDELALTRYALSLSPENTKLFKKAWGHFERWCVVQHHPVAKVERGRRGRPRKTALTHP